MTTLWRWLALLTGGRPMRWQGEAFVDVVSGEKVGYYTDTFGRRWLATGPWKRFRVAAAIEEGA